MTQTLVVVGSGLMQIPIYEHARAMGLETIGLDRDPNSKARELATHWYECEISDEAACIELLRRLGKPFHGVLTVGTDFSTTVARIAEEFELLSHSYQAAHAAKDKAAMRQRLEQAGIRVPNFLVLADNDAVNLQAVNLPIVVKPVDNMGARGVKKIETFSDLPQAIGEARTFSQSRRVILEDFIPGPEFSLDAFIHPTGFFRRGLADRDIRFPPYFVELGHSFPSQAEVSVQEALWRRLEEAARALGLSWGAVKGDLKFDGKEPVVGEVAARLSGGFMSGWTYPLASGIHPVREAILLALGQPPTKPDYPIKRAVSEGAVIGIPGLIQRWMGLEELKNSSLVAYFFLMRQEGDALVFPKNNVEKAANIIVTGKNAEEAAINLRWARKTLWPRLKPHQSQTDEWLSNPQQPAFVENKDWYGITWDERKEQVRQIGGAVWKKLGKNQHNLVWDALASGGLVGAVYWLDSSTPLP